jgi:Flp pilus assembly protein TadG
MKERRWYRLWASRDGLGAIEFAFVAPFLLTLLLGVLEFGLAFWQRIEVASAADAGVQWGMSNPYDETSIRSVVQAATSLAIPAGNITPSNPCGCATSTGITTGYGSPPSCTACPDTTTAKPYIVVNVHTCYSTLFPSWPGLTYGGDGCTSSQISLAAQSFVLK